MFLEIKDLSVKIENRNILKSLNLNINKGEVHAIMGPNGSGKSTLANVLAGKEDYEILNGRINYKDNDLFDLNIEERAQEGMFLAFQYPVEIPGVNITPFLHSAINSKRKRMNEEEIDNLSFAKLLKSKASDLGINIDMLKRSVNTGFSGGEKKRYEILQMSILNPDLAILDETDSGLDIDALKIVTDGVNKLKTKDNSFLIITHYQKLLDYIKPDYVHVMVNGSQDNYLKNKKNIFFSENKNIQNHREKLINIFENDRFDKKNNESLKNINLKNFIDFKYKYLIPEETSVINNNHENSYSIVSVNGQCSSFKDDKIEITKILDEDYNDFSKNDTIENNDHFVNLNSLFLNSGFKIVIKKNKNIKIKISNIITDDDLTIFQKNNYICEEGSSLNLIEE